MNFKTTISVLIALCIVTCPYQIKAQEAPDLPTIARETIDIIMAQGPPPIITTDPSFVSTVTGWIGVAVVIVIVAVVIYAVIWFAQKIPPPAQPTDPPDDPAIIGQWGEIPSRPGTVMYSDSPEAQLQINGDLTQTNWATLYRFQLSNFCEVTNGTGSHYYGELRVLGTNNTVVAVSAVFGVTNSPIILTPAKPLNLPAPEAEKMFFRLR